MARSKPGARGQTGREALRRRRLGRALAACGALGLLVAAALAAPTLADGYTALQWTRHYAAGGGVERPAERARQAGRWAARAVDLLAPLPQAAEAAALALQVGVVLEGEQPSAALALYPQVRSALERQRASRWRGIGLAQLTDEARAREQAASSAADGSGASRAGRVPSAVTAPVVTPPAGAPTTAGAAPAVGVSPSLPPSVSPASSPSPPAAVARSPSPKPSRGSKPKPRPTGARP